jgi:hypothetical protein
VVAIEISWEEGENKNLSKNVLFCPKSAVLAKEADYKSWSYFKRNVIAEIWAESCRISPERPERGINRKSYGRRLCGRHRST